MELLEAVNYVLSWLGDDDQLVADDLLDPHPDVQAVLNRISETRRTILRRGWYFNIIQRTFTPDGSEEIQSTGILQVLPDVRDEAITIRNSKLFRPEYDTYQFGTNDVRLCIVEDLEWDFIPEAWQELIKQKAAEAAVKIDLEDNSKAAGLLTEIQTAQTLAMQEELDNKRLNALQSPAASRARYRVHPYRFNR